MKYLTDHFNLNMINETAYTLTTHALNKKKFIKQTKKAKCSIGSQLIAKILHKPREKQRLNLKRGDEIYVVNSEFGRKHSCEYTKNYKLRFEIIKIT